MKRIKAVFFDFDGTLFKLNTDWNKVRKILKEFFKRYNLKSEFKPLFKEIVNLLRKLKAIKGKREVIIAGKKVNNLIKKEEIKGIDGGELVKGAMEVLLFLKRKGIFYGIFTQNSKIVIEKVISKYRLPQPLIIIGRENVGFFGIKPYRLAGKIILKKFGFKKQNILYVGNSFDDCRFGKNFGLRTYILENKKNLFPKKEIDSVINLRELKDILDYIKVI